MRILLALEPPRLQRLLFHTLKGWGFQPMLSFPSDALPGELSRPDAPRLVLLGTFGDPLLCFQICRQIRQQRMAVRPYLLLLLPSRRDTPDSVQALACGADDVLLSCCPSLNELATRLDRARRILRWQDAHQPAPDSLWDCSAREDFLIPICAWCKKVRTPQGVWQRPANVDLLRTKMCTHGLCPCCYHALMQEARLYIHPGKVQNCASSNCGSAWGEIDAE